MIEIQRDNVQSIILASFRERGIDPISISVRDFPSETIIIVEVAQEVRDQALKFSTPIEQELPPGHLMVVRGVKLPIEKKVGSVSSVNDERVSRLVELLNERSRTSEQQPSLEYIKDAGENLRIAMTRRHHIVYGRRGVGKTALLLEAKRQIERINGLVLWVNMQVLRGLDARRAFLTLVQRVCEMPAVIHRSRSEKPASVALADSINSSAHRLLDQAQITAQNVASLVPKCQRLIAHLCAESAGDLFIFIDDLHYLEMNEQPIFLDLVHGITRDTSAWIKAAGIRNQCRTFIESPPTGLQSGHDAAEIPLDITLEEPKKARKFLSDVLVTYLSAANVSNRKGFMSNGALDRLVLASAGVPRDFLLLTARSIQITRLRDNARTVGAQDVNEAAGQTGKQKLADLEDDAASSVGQSTTRLAALGVIRSFSIDTHHCSFFRISLRDKNQRPDAYRLLQSLTDLRMIHLVKASLSEQHAVGERSEVYMLDLSEYSGSRFKRNLTVIELQGDILVLRKTGKDRKVLAADTARKVVQVFRTGPMFELELIADLAQTGK